MNKLLSADFARLKKDTFLKFCLIFMFIIGILCPVISYKSMIKYEYTVYLENNFFSYSSFMVILFSAFCSLFIGTEYSDGTIRNKLIIGHKRMDIYLSNLITCIISGFAMCAAYLISYLCVGVPLLGFFTAVEIRVVWIFLGCNLVLTIALAAIFTLISMLNQNKALSAVICISDPLRPEARAVIQQLRRLGIQRAVMLTGDSERTAAAIAAEVGVDEYRAEILPVDKAGFVEAERAKGHTVIMIGDGINDSPALSKADVGIAISDGAAIAREIADITIAADNLFELVSLRRIAIRLTERIRSNYRFVIGFNSSLIALGALGILPPATSATLHNLSTLGISLRSMTNLLETS